MNSKRTDRNLEREKKPPLNKWIDTMNEQQNSKNKLIRSL